jgi:FKBP-type peptidyl-prolyl cis-trans isomerase
MNKQAVVGVGIGLSLLLVLGGTVFWGLKESSKKPQQVLSQTTMSIGDDSTSNLNVQSSSAVPLGNLPGENSGQATTSSSNNSGISMGNQGEPTTGPTSGSANSGNAKSSTLDPANFGEYDKYKNEKNAMFGEIQAGTGKVAESGKTIVVNYRGWLTNGKVFDENISSDKPFSFVLGSGSVIPGWDQGIAGMKVGGERLIIVPPAVGYGAVGQGPIPGNAVIVFDVKLLDVK